MISSYLSSWAGAECLFETIYGKTNGACWPSIRSSRLQTQATTRRTEWWHMAAHEMLIRQRKSLLNFILDSCTPYRTTSSFLNAVATAIDMGVHALNTRVLGSNALPKLELTSATTFITDCSVFHRVKIIRMWWTQEHRIVKSNSFHSAPSRRRFGVIERCRLVSCYMLGGQTIFALATPHAVRPSATTQSCRLKPTTWRRGISTRRKAAAVRCETENARSLPVLNVSIHREADLQDRATLDIYLYIQVGTCMIRYFSE